MSDPHPPVPPRIYALLGLLAFMWSANFIFAKIALRDIPGPILAALRFTTAGVCILPVFLLKRRHELPSMHKRPGFLRLLFAAAIGVGLNQISFMLGLERTNVANAAIILSLTPMAVTLITNYLGHEKATRNKLVGLGIAVTGVAALQFRHLNDLHRSSPAGDALIFLSAMTWAWFTVTGKSVRGHFDGLTINTFCYAGSMVVFLPFNLWLLTKFDYERVSLASWLSVAYMAVIPSLLGMSIYYHSMRYVSATRISMLSYAQPLLATLFALPILGEPVTASIIAGGAMVLAGVFVAERT